MTENIDEGRLREAIVDGLGHNKADIDNALSALKHTPVNYLELVQEGTTFLKQLLTTETPSDPEEIATLSKKSVIFATYRANFFEKVRLPALDDEQLEHLLMRTHELWGEYPSEPIGRWVDWCLWTHLHRRHNGVPITEVVAGDKTADDLKQSWIDRHRDREERRRLEKIDKFDRYDAPNQVPMSIRHLVMSPFIEDEEVANVEPVPDESVPETPEE